MEHLKNCPICLTQWQSDRRIAEDLRCHPAYKDYTDEQIVEAASHYGDTPETPQYFSKLIGLEGTTYDGVSHWVCPECKNYWDRFTNEHLGIYQELTR